MTIKRRVNQRRQIGNVIQPCSHVWIPLKSTPLLMIFETLSFRKSYSAQNQTSNKAVKHFLCVLIYPSCRQTCSQTFRQSSRQCRNSVHGRQRMASFRYQSMSNARDMEILRSIFLRHMLRNSCPSRFKILC